MSNNNPPPLLDRIWHATLLVFGIVIVLWLALQLLAQFWGWLLLIGGFIVAVGILIHILRARRDRW